MKVKLLFIFSLQPKNFIKNSENPTCKDCIHFIEDKDLYNKYYLGKCNLFGDKDNISGEINYNYAKTCRNSNNLCGNNGKYYEKKLV